MWDTAYVSIDWFDRKHFHKWCVSIKCTVSHWLSIARACKELRFLFPFIGLRQFLKWYYHLLVHLGYHMKVSCLEIRFGCCVTAVPGYASFEMIVYIFTWSENKKGAHFLSRCLKCRVYLLPLAPNRQQSYIGVRNSTVTHSKFEPSRFCIRRSSTWYHYKHI